MEIPLLDSIPGALRRAGIFDPFGVGALTCPPKPWRRRKGRSSIARGGTPGFERHPASLFRSLQGCQPPARRVTPGLLAAALSLLLVPPVHADVTDGLVAWYPFDGNANDASGYGRHGMGTLVSYTGYTNGPAGLSGTALFITNDAAVVDIPDMTGSHLSASLWYYFTKISGGTWNALLSRDGMGYVHLVTQGEVIGVCGREGVGFISSGYPFAPSNWYHLVVVMTGSSVKLYVNRQLKLDDDRFFDNSNYPLSRIGNMSPTVQGAWGAIDDVRIYNRVLSSNEVDELWAHPATGSDTDGDGMADWWEILYGLNALVNDANEDLDLDGLANIQEYQLGLKPQLADSNGDGVNDYRQVYGKEWTRYYYDRIDRLLGGSYSRGSNGFAIAYQYDGNGNILRQVYLQHDQDRDGLLDFLEFQNGLCYTNAGLHGGAYGDLDGDGWSNYQELQGRSSPTNPASVPDFLGPAGMTAGVFQVGFTPSNFVMAVGHLDGQGAEEIVIGADGDPGNWTNCIWILSQSAGGVWSTQRVEIGKVGITSIGIGQVTTNEPAAIYLGTRCVGATGTIVQVKPVTGNWSQAMVAISTSSVAYVLGVRSNLDVLISLGRTNAPDQCLSSAFRATNGVWYMRTVETNTSHRGFGTVDVSGLGLPLGSALRLLL